MKRPTILITEEDETLRQNLKEGLLRHGFEVIEASEKTEALQSIRNRSPTLAIIGSSPNGRWDGLAVAKQIRQHDRKLPIILIVRQSSEARVLAALRAGVNDYFMILFSTEEVM